MDIAQVRQSAETLDAARAGTITAPIPWADIPGDHAFGEGFLDDVPSVSEAYARFKVVLTGSERLTDGLHDTPQ